MKKQKNKEELHQKNWDGQEPRDPSRQKVTVAEDARAAAAATTLDAQKRR